MSSLEFPWDPNGRVKQKDAEHTKSTSHLHRFLRNWYAKKDPSPTKPRSAATWTEYATAAAAPGMGRRAGIQPGRGAYPRPGAHPHS